MIPSKNSGPHWWVDCGEIARLLRWLNDAPDGPLEVAVAIDIVATPWSWTDEYNDMVEQQRGAGPGLARAAEDEWDEDTDVRCALLEASLHVARGAKG